VRFGKEVRYVKMGAKMEQAFASPEFNHISVVHVGLGPDLSFTFDFQAEAIGNAVQALLVRVLSTFPHLRLLYFSNEDAVPALRLTRFLSETNAAKFQELDLRNTASFSAIFSELYYDFLYQAPFYESGVTLQKKTAFVSLLTAKMLENHCLFPFRNNIFVDPWKRPHPFLWDEPCILQLDWDARPLPSTLPAIFSDHSQKWLKFKGLFTWTYIAKRLLKEAKTQVEASFEAASSIAPAQIDLQASAHVGYKQEFAIEEVVQAYFPKTSLDIGKGAYFGIHVLDKQMVFIKVDYVPEGAMAFSNIKREAMLLSELQNCTEMGIPRLIWTGSYFHYNVMVTERLGPSLSHLSAQYCPFSMQTTLSLAKQLIQSVAYLHFMGLMHRDIKPANLCMGPPSNPHKLYLVDFETCQRFDTEESCRVGTYDYMSLNVHSKLNYSWFDDMESVGYVLVSFAKGYLPWRHISKNYVKEKYSRFSRRLYEKEISNAKKYTTHSELCSGLPIEFELYFEYVRGENNSIASFERSCTQKPDYIYLQQLFSKAALRLNLDITSPAYEWSP